MLPLQRKTKQYVIMEPVEYKQYTIERYYVIKEGYEILGKYGTMKKARLAHVIFGRGEILAACAEEGAEPVYAPNMTAAMRKIKSIL